MASPLVALVAANTIAATEISVEDDKDTSALSSCANDPDFAVICAFFQKFSTHLQIDHPNFKNLQDWLSNTDEVPSQLRDLHIKLLRKTRKTVHEKSWESALSKFCFTYSSQDGWELERFGYKKSSLKVKLRILRELLESQFERNIKFRSKILALSADSLRTQPIGRDRLGHSYWLTQDMDCNLRIYQEHLDEEIWQVVASNRDELVKLISRLRGNEVVLPSTDIGIVDEDSSSNSCSGPIDKPPPPEEKDDSQEESANSHNLEIQTESKNIEAKVPNLRIKLAVGNQESEVVEIRICDENNTKKEKQTCKEESEEVATNDKEIGDFEEDKKEDINNDDSEDPIINNKMRIIKPDHDKKVKPLVISQAKIGAGSPSEVTIHEIRPKKRPFELFDKDTSSAIDAAALKKQRPTLLDSNREKKLSRYEKAKESDDEDNCPDDGEEGELDEEEEEEEEEEISDGEEEDDEIDSTAADDENEEEDYEDNEDFPEGDEIEDPVVIVKGEGTGKDCDSIAQMDFSSNGEEVTEAIEEEVMFVYGEGHGAESMVGNTKNEPEPKATFFFGQPGCLKLSPLKPQSTEPNNSSSSADIKNDLQNICHNRKETAEEKPLDEALNGDKISEDSAKETVNNSQEPQSVSSVLEVEKVEEKNDSSGIVEIKNELIEEKAHSEKAVEDVLPAKLDLPEKQDDNVIVNESKEKREPEETIESLPKTPPLLSPTSPSKVQIPTILTIPNRKRRLSNALTEQTKSIVSSESDLDSLSENAEDDQHIDGEEIDIGGKRLKMRPKITNVDVRKKIEAKRTINAAEETTSSSSEEDNRTKRKLTAVIRKSKIEAEVNEVVETKTSTRPEEKELEKSVILGNDVLRISPVREKNLPQSQTELSVEPIIEKKLNETEILAEIVQESKSPPKKSPITKPPKKNILTQLLRQDEIDEEVPRKRTISDATDAGTSAVVPSAGVVVESENVPCEIPSIDSKPPLQLPTTTAASAPTQRKRRSSEKTKEQTFRPKSESPTVLINSEDNLGEETSVKMEKLDKEILPVTDQEINSVQCSNENKVEEKSEVDIKRERKSPSRSEEEMLKNELSPVSKSKQQASKEEPVNIEEVIEPLSKRQETLSPNSSMEKSIELQEPVISPTKTRSSRRSGPPEVFSELVQPKRTRAKNLPQKSSTETNKEIMPEDVKDANLKMEKEPEIKRNDTNVEKPCSPPANTASVVAIIESPKKIDLSPPTPVVIKPTPTTKKTPGPRKKRDVDTTNILDAGDSEITPVRQSRRIAQLKIREEAERRKLEEIALRSMKNELKKKKKAEMKVDPTVSEPSDHEEHSSEENSEVETKKKPKAKKCPGKGGWSSGSEEHEEPEEEEEHYYESDPGSPLFKSDHEFSPESELEDESQVVPMKRARTARKEGVCDREEKGDEYDESSCQKCGKSDHPEWILLCDKCDKGYHCSCLSPVLFYIPEGDWFCPPCQQEELIVALENQLKQFDQLVERKKKEYEEELIRIKQEEKEAQERELKEKNRKKYRHKTKGGHGDENDEDEDDDDDDNDDDVDDDDGEKNENDGEKNRSKVYGNVEDEDMNRKSRKEHQEDSANSDVGRRRAGRFRRTARSRRASGRGIRRRHRSESCSSSRSQSFRSSSHSSSKSHSRSSSKTNSDDEPIYKLRKRRQINVSYRLNEYDDMLKSALKEEMDDVAGAGNLGRGKDISTIIEADKEEQARQRQRDEVDSLENPSDSVEPLTQQEQKETEEIKCKKDNAKIKKHDTDGDSGSDMEPLKRKMKANKTLKKKSRKLTALDISSEGENYSDEDFKTSSFEEDEEDESISGSSNTDSSLEVYRRRGKRGGKKKNGSRRTARRAARERRKDRKFIVEDTDESDDQRPRSKKKRKDDSDFTETETNDDDVSELSENVDSADLCDDSSSEPSDGAWRPSKRKKQRTNNTIIARKSPKLKKGIAVKQKKVKRVEYTDDDVTESEVETDIDDGIGSGKGSGKGYGKGSGKEPAKVSGNGSGKASGKGSGKGSGKCSGKVAGKGSGKGSSGKSPIYKKKKSNFSEDDESSYDSDDSTRKTRGRRYAYLDDYEDESSDGGIKPGVKRPDTPPEEREKFIKRQEEIKRMLAEKNAEGAKLAATPRLTPIKGDKQAIAGRTPAKNDSLSTVPLSVIRQAKVLDIDYLQRKGESISDTAGGGEAAADEVESDFDDDDLPDDFNPEDMDEEAIARMVEEEEEFSQSSNRELPSTDMLTGLKSTSSTNKTSSVTAMKSKEADPSPSTARSSIAISTPSTSHHPQHSVSTSGLQEPVRKKLPIPTMHPPLLRHQFPQSHSGVHHSHHLSHQQNQLRHPHPSNSHPPSHLLQNALSAPLNQPISRNFQSQVSHHMQSQHHSTQLHQTSRHQQQQDHLNPSEHSTSAASDQGKPRGRRKKITPLRDPLQKQQAAAAATAAAVAATNVPVPSTKVSNKTNSGSSGSGSGTNPEQSTISAPAPGGVIKASPLSIAQPPQLYKPPSANTQPSVITRMPHLPPNGNRGYPGGDPSARFYPPSHQLPQQLPPAGSRPTTLIRHRGHSQMPQIPPTHHSSGGMRPAYVCGPPPPLRGVGPPREQPAQSTRHSYPSPQDQHGQPPPASYGPPPPARHAAPHLNPYRPQMYGNPNYPLRPTAPPVTNIRPGHGQEYSPQPRSYATYGYYPPPPPPPLTVQGQPHSVVQPTVTAVPSSVIVAAPPSVTSINNSHAAAVASRNISPSASGKSSPINKETHSAVLPPSAIVAHPNVATEPRKRLITLESFSTAAKITTVRSPLPIITGEPSGSRSPYSSQTPTVISDVQPDGADDSSSAIAPAVESQPSSEFSGLVSYFSSQHDDYNS